MALGFEYKQQDEWSLVASVWLGVLFVGVLAVWARWRDVLLPARNFVRVVVLAGGAAGALTMLCYRPRRRVWWRNTAYVGAVVVALLGIRALPSRVELGVREHEAELVAAAERYTASPPTTPDACEPAPAGLTVDGLGPLEQVCWGGPGGGVEFRHSTPTMTEGVVYLPTGGPQPQSSCVKELYGSWLQYVRGPDPNCPFGFEFTGGG